MRNKITKPITLIKLENLPHNLTEEDLDDMEDLLFGECQIDCEAFNLNDMNNNIEEYLLNNFKYYSSTKCKTIIYFLNRSKQFIYTNFYFIKEKELRKLIDKYIRVRTFK